MPAEPNQKLASLLGLKNVEFPSRQTYYRIAGFYHEH